MSIKYYYCSYCNERTIHQDGECSVCGEPDPDDEEQ